VGFLFKAADTFFALRFLRLLTMPWTKTGAYKEGIIDKDGKVIKKPDTPKEKEVYNLFHKLVFNIKRLLNKLPFGKSTIASYAAGLFLIKEHTGMSDILLAELLEESFGYNPLHDIDLNEAVEDGPIQSGNYILNESLFFVNGDMLSPMGDATLTINESSTEKIGSIFNIPIYKAKDNKTNQFILVTDKNITKI
jgi:hypothetical protein